MRRPYARAYGWSSTVRLCSTVVVGHRRRHARIRARQKSRSERNARADLLGRLERGEISAPRGIALREARERFVTAAGEGRALNKHGRRYKPKAIANIEECLRRHVEPTLAAAR